MAMRDAVRVALVRILRESEAHAAINDLTELLGVNDLQADTEANIADALLGRAEPADLTIQSVAQTAWGTVLLDTHGRLFLLYQTDDGAWGAKPMRVTVKRTQPDD